MTELLDEISYDRTTGGQPVQVEVERGVGISFLLVLQEEIVCALLLYFVFIGWNVHGIMFLLTWQSLEFLFTVYEQDVLQKELLEVLLQISGDLLETIHNLLLLVLLHFGHIWNNQQIKHFRMVTQESLQSRILVACHKEVETLPEVKILPKYLLLSLLLSLDILLLDRKGV